MTPHTAFVGLVGFAGAYFLFRRKADPLSIAFAGCCIYFAPGLLGSIDIYLAGAERNYISDIVPGAYATMAMVVAAVSIAAIAVDSLPQPAAFAPQFDRYLAPTLLAVALATAAVSIFTVGPFYLCGEKTDMLSHIDTWYYYASYALPLCIIGAMATEQTAIVFICAALLAADIFIGFRANAAVTLLSACVLTGHRLFEGPRRAAQFLAVVVLCGAGLFIVKQAVYTLKYATAPVCTRALAAEVFGKRVAAGDDVETARKEADAIIARPRAAAADQLRQFAKQLEQRNIYFNAMMQSEPFVIQATLNEVVRSGFTTETDYLWRQILTGVPGGASIFGLKLGKVPTFNGLFQPKLFPKTVDGMANNPWAQAYAAGGLPLVALFAAGFAAIVSLLTWLTGATTGALRGCIIVLAVWLAFYFQRNDLMIQIGIIKQVAYTIVVAFLLATLAARLSHYRQNPAVAPNLPGRKAAGRCG